MIFQHKSTESFLSKVGFSVAVDTSFSDFSQTKNRVGVLCIMGAMLTPLRDGFHSPTLVRDMVSAACISRGLDSFDLAGPRTCPASSLLAARVALANQGPIHKRSPRLFLFFTYVSLPGLGDQVSTACLPTAKALSSPNILDRPTAVLW